MSEFFKNPLVIIGAVLVGVFFVMPMIVAAFLRDVEAGTIRIVSWLHGNTVIYRGPGKSKEIPLLTTGTTISSKVINVDLDITDQTADFDENDRPQPIKVRVLASAIVSVGDTDVTIKTAANRFFAKPDADQMSALTDLLSSSGRRAINLLTHDQLFSAKASTRALPPMAREAGVSLVHAESSSLPVPLSGPGSEEEDDPLAVIIRKACSRELADLGLVFNSLNIKAVQSEVAEARRRMSAAEAQANADIVSAQQARRAKEAQLEADREVSNKQRELDQTRASNAALVAQAEAKRQESVAVQRAAELDATQIAQANADAERMRIEAGARADAEAIRITRVAEAQAGAIQKVNDAIKAGGDAYFRLRQIEMLPEIAPVIAAALAASKLITISGGGEAGGAAQSATSNITSVIQTVLAAQLVAKSGMMDAGSTNNSRPADAPTPSLPSSDRAGATGSTGSTGSTTKR